MSKLLPFVLLLALLAAPGSASADQRGYIPHVKYQEMKELSYKYGPVKINPGQNTVDFSGVKLNPTRPGFITRFTPNLLDSRTGRPVPVSVMHMHHVVWLVNGKPTFAAGEEKTALQSPRGFGVEVSGQEQWAVNYMIHNLTDRPHSVYLAWNIDFVPQSSPAARVIKPAQVQWMDVAGTKPYPVFDAVRGWGSNGRYTFPDQAKGSERQKIGRDYRWRVPSDLTLVYAVSHVHPGSLYTTMYATRGGVRKQLFRSRVKYFPTGGRNSWDMATSATPPGWRVKLRAGDLVSIHTTVDTTTSSWRESMGIMPPLVYDGHDAGGIDPFTSRKPIPQRGVFSHRSLPENRIAGGSPSGLRDPRALPSGPSVSLPVAIKGFRYRFGDPGSQSLLSRPPLVRSGQPLRFINLDAPETLAPSDSAYHTITACRAPCTATTGGAYPREDGPVSFDSGQLGFGPQGSTPTANRNTWSTPRNLSPGTYTFFCRIHPFMRGAFRVTQETSSSDPVSAGWEPLSGYKGAQ